MKHVANMQQLVAEIIMVRDVADAAECRFIQCLVGAEKRQDLWGVEKYRTFEAFLAGENICKPSRYHTGKNMLGKYGEDVCQAIGIANTVIVDRLPQDTRPRAIEAITRYKEVNGSIPSQQTARAMLKPFGLRTNPVPKNFRREEFDYVAECARLRERVAELELENAALRLQLSDIATAKTSANAKRGSTKASA